MVMLRSTLTQQLDLDAAKQSTFSKDWIPLVVYQQSLPLGFWQQATFIRNAASSSVEALQQQQTLSHLSANECLSTMFIQDAAPINQLTDPLRWANLCRLLSDFRVSGGTELLTNRVIA
ncbi:hypothetical protein ATANTOWER_018343 [Ataeniobius toweri]|uniref:Uncharacterized protein n=1 Tax=Ataeniobius toweri TaxID=208326 RepID=A0ABU7BSX7_9TELE|nr:hypothetical protein [Ataeniobius toweri]